MFDTPARAKPWHVRRPPTAVDARTTPVSRVGAAIIDLRLEMDKILMDHGHLVYLRRAMSRRCGCYNEVTKESVQTCPQCTGTGWLYQDELHLTRRMPITDPVVAALMEQRSPVGLVGVDQSVFWFKYDVNPGIRDVILEITLGDDGQPTLPVQIEAIWNIGQLYDARDRNGRVEFWACWVRRGAMGKE